MDISNFKTGKIGHMALISFALLCGSLVTSCNSAIYDSEGDCLPHYRVGFCYDRNMKFADAFSHEVEAVTLYIVDNNGNIVWYNTDDGEPLTHKGYTMDVDIAPGCYSLLAWAGDSEQHSFEIGPAARSGHNELTAELIRKRDSDGKAVSEDRLSRLYHGYVSDVVFPEDEGQHSVTVPLTKNTNYIKVILQQVGGNPMNVNDLEVTITDDNGLMEWDNSLRQDEDITYRPWCMTPISASISPNDEDGADVGVGSVGTYTGVMVEFSTARLVEGHRDRARLTVRDHTSGKTVFSIKLIDFLLLVKGEYNRAMGDQEYLDRQDVFDLVFFLDEDHRWIKSAVFINSWKVVLDNVDFQ